MTPPARGPGSPWVPWALLAVGVMSVGAAAILIRLAQAPALALSFWRTFIGGAALLVVVGVLRRPFPRGEHLARAVVAGIFLGAHFWLWIASLERTSVAASVVLVCLQPVFVTLIAFAVFRERTPLRGALGIVIALGGTALIALDGEGTGAIAGSMFGNALALAGAVAIAAYVLVGRRTAGQVDVLAYSTTVSLVAAASLLVPLLLSSSPALPPSSTSWMWVMALALGPQLLGHTALNAALARLPASVVSGSILGEPIIATALAWLLLDERPGALTLVGSAIVLGGLFLLLSRPRPAH